MVKLTKVSMLGFDLEFKNPDALYVAIWIGFWYFLYRYYQYFASEGIHRLREVFGHAFDTKCEPIIRGIVRKEYPLTTSPHFTYSILKSWGWVFHGQHSAGFEETSETPTDFRLPVSRWMLRRGIAKAVLEGVLRSSVVTDYILPFGVAAFVLWYCGKSNWQGSLVWLLF